MLNSELYDGLDQSLYEERMKAKDSCFDFNNTYPSDTKAKQEILHKLLGKIGNEVIICQRFYCDYGCNIEVGNNFFSNHNLIILDCAKVSFGDNVLIGPNCSFNTPKHPLDVKTRNKFLEYAYPIKVGNNVWIASNVTICGGVTIGDNVVIGAGSDVTKDIPSNSLAFGVPAKVVKHLDE